MYGESHVKDYKNPLHLDVVDRYLRRMGDKTIPDEAPPRFCVSFTNELRHLIGCPRQAPGVWDRFIPA